MYKLLLPEIFITMMACLILLGDMYVKKPLKFITYAVSVGTLVVASIITYTIVPVTATMVLHNAFVVDKFACVLKMIIYVLLACIFIYARIYMRVRDMLHGEFYALALFSLLGMMILISSSNFLTLYLGIELLVLPLYTMIVLVKQDIKYKEAALKYFIIGALGAGLLLYGVSLIYGATGTIDFIAFSETVSSPILLKLGLMFVIVGVALEFGAVPFHMWLPDVYEGSTTVVTMIIATIPKIAVFAMTYRLLTLAFTTVTAECQQMFLLLALASIVLGNIMAIAQNNIKRMLAYSTISHMGFILLGLFAAPQVGYVATIFYTIVYAFMALAAFAVIMRLSAQGFEAELISDFRGLNKRAPWLAFIMLLIMFALAGVPPLVGFYAKLQILQAVVTAGYPWFAIISLLFSVMGAFYYLRIIRVMYFEEPVNSLPVPVANDMSLFAKVLVSSHGLLLLLLGIFPASIISLCIAMLKP